MPGFKPPAAARCLAALLIVAVPLLAVAPAPAQAQPRAPRGVYATIDILDYVTKNGLPLIPMPGQDAQLIAYYDGLLANPAIAGLHIELHWKLGQPNPPPAALNLLYVDDAFTEAASYGKTVQLDVTGGFNSPQWLWDSSQPTGLPSCDPIFLNPTQSALNCGTVTFNYYGENTDQDGNTVSGSPSLVLPLPWNSTYIADWQAFISALQSRYGSNDALVAVVMAGPTAASPEMIMPNNFNTCASGQKGPCYTCPNGIPSMASCTPGTGGFLAEDMWNTLFANAYSDPNQLYPQNSDRAFIQLWTATIDFYESLFSNVTLIVTPGAGTGFPSFGSTGTYPTDPNNVLYGPECQYSATGGSTYIKGNFAIASCDAATTIMYYLMKTNGGTNNDGMASLTAGMEAQDATQLGSSTTADTGDVGVPGVKYLAAYSLSAGPPQQEVLGARNSTISSPL